jgi:hypothetical protein
MIPSISSEAMQFKSNAELDWKGKEAEEEDEGGGRMKNGIGGESSKFQSGNRLEKYYEGGEDGYLKRRRRGRREGIFSKDLYEEQSEHFLSFMRHLPPF